MISFASGSEAYPLLMFATQVVLSVNRMYFLLVQSFLNVDTARTIAISSLRLMSVVAGFKLRLQRVAKK